MKATLILADAAQHDPAGKVHALGLGWSVIGSPSPPIALVMLIDCPWDETNQKHKMLIELVDADGRTVSFQNGPLGDPQPAVHLEAEFESGRPPGFPPGTPIRQQMVVNMPGGMPLPVDQKYEFRLTIDGNPQDSTLAAFYVRPNPGPPIFQG